MLIALIVLQHVNVGFWNSSGCVKPDSQLHVRSSQHLASVLKLYRHPCCIAC